MAGPTPYIVTAYCPGPDLGAWLAARRGGVAWAEAAAFIAALANAVQFAHEHGVYHRDLKPSNVLLASHDSASPPGDRLGNDRPRLTDFGLAKLANLNAVETRSSLLLGTPLYMAPGGTEGGRRDATGGRFDVYSLGCMLYELVGRQAAAGSRHLRGHDRPAARGEAECRQLRRAGRGPPRDLEVIFSPRAWRKTRPHGTPRRASWRTICGSAWGGPAAEPAHGPAVAVRLLGNPAAARIRDVGLVHAQRADATHRVGRRGAHCGSKHSQDSCGQDGPHVRRVLCADVSRSICRWRSSVGTRRNRNRGPCAGWRCPL